MTDTPTYTASQFARSFAEIQLRAQKEPVAVKNHGRVTGYFVSKDEYEELQRLKALRGRARGVAELTKAELKRLAKTEMDPRHALLDRLLSGPKHGRTNKKLLGQTLRRSLREPSS